jgi:hypothetical protein
LDWLVLGLVLFLIAALVLPYLQPDNSLPAGLLLPSTSRFENGTVQLFLISQRTGPESKLDDLEFVLVNGSRQDIYFRGYTPDSFTSWPPLDRIHPSYEKEVLWDGEWSVKLMWCGNGVAWRRLRPGHAGKFTGCIHDYEPTIRFAVRYTLQPQDHEPAMETVSSCPLTFSGRKED